MQELNSIIEFWNEKLIEDSKLCDLALLQVFIKAEKYFVKVFIDYSTGIPSSQGYVAERKLNFIDDSHLNNFLQSMQGGTFIDYMKILENSTKYFFVDNKDPFALIFSDGNFMTSYYQIKSIRNYVAHESQESRNKYMKQCLGGVDRIFIIPKDYLLKKVKNSKDSHYSYYVKQLLEKATILSNPLPYF